MSVISPLIIASRESPLAMWQAQYITARLEALYPGREVRILGLTTRGDQILDRALAAVGGKGLFVKELEDAMQRGDADLAVHSMKDVPMHLPDGFCMAAIGSREDPRDAFVSNRFETLEQLPAGAVIGTSSLRRQSQLMARFPDLRIEPLRGNVGTRLRKLDEEQYAAIILAAAGLKRLGLGDRIRSLISTDDSLPAVGQGALGIECLASRADVVELLAPLHDPMTADCVVAERAMSRALAGSCQVPLGGYAEIEGNTLHLRGFVASPDGRRMARGEIRGPRSEGESLGERLAQTLIAQGADRILADLAAQA